MFTLGQWLSCKETSVKAVTNGERAQRISRGRHALQLAVDTVAFGQNIPLRLLLVDRLKDLRKVVEDIAIGDAGKKLLNDARKERGDDLTDLSSLYQQSTFAQRASSSLKMFQDEQTPEKPSDELRVWLLDMVVLLPHIERQVWLTEMGNPLPAHALARMVDQWSLFVLLWCYDQAKRNLFEAPQVDTSERAPLVAFGIKGYELRVLPGFAVTNAKGEELNCILIAGPIWNQTIEPNKEIRVKKFLELWRHVLRICSLVDGWADESEKAPSKDELIDSFNSRQALSNAEIVLRANSSQVALVQYLLNVSFDSDGNVPTCRDKWEQLALYCCWFARWEPLLNSFDAHRRWSSVGCWVIRAPHSHGLHIKRVERLPLNKAVWALHWKAEKPEHAWEMQHLKTGVLKLWPGVHVDSPDVFWNRTLERQNAAWTAHIVAVNHLLHSHGRGLKNAPPDALESAPPDPPYQEAAHLLQGYGGRICHYLLGMVRADVADIYWMDYADEKSPRLVHVGGYARAIEHRAERQQIHQDFHNWAWVQPSSAMVEGVPVGCTEAERGKDSASQAYRVAVTGVADVPAADSKDSVPPNAYFGSFPRPVPQAAMAFPLLVNGRVAGVLTLAGLNQHQFCARLVPPLHHMANLVARAMYQTSQLWHMRRLNHFFAHTHPRHFKQHNAENGFNPLKDVSRLLTNVFLCRAVHIWIQTPSEQIKYKLHGYNQRSLFVDDKGILNDAPWLKVKRTVMAGAEDIGRAFLGFAIDLPGPVQMAQGQYDPRVEVTSAYNRDAAEKGMVIGRDFVTCVEMQGHAKHRWRIFTQEGLWDLAALALIDVTPSGDDKKGRGQVVGGLTLHGTPLERDTAEEGCAAQPRPWNRAWEPTVAHIQSYLPYLLRQVAVLYNPLDATRKFLMHEGTAEFQSLHRWTRDRSDYMRQLLGPDSALRTYLEKQSETDSKVSTLLQPVEMAWKTFNPKHTLNALNSLEFITKALGNFHTLADLNMELDVTQSWIGLKDSVNTCIENYHSFFAPILGFRRTRIVPGKLVLDREVEIFVRAPWWNRVVENLIQNASKYALHRFEVIWNTQKRSLTFVNEGAYCEQMDMPDRLIEWNYQGGSHHELQKNTKKAQGHGFGLWGAKFMCNLEGFGFHVEVNPQSGTPQQRDCDGRIWGTAEYRFEIDFSNTPDKVKVYGGAALA